MMNPHLYCVIMAGGSGTRFWPASRRDRPKQFLPISGRLPMIAETQARLEGLVPIERVLVVTQNSTSHQRTPADTTEGGKKAQHTVTKSRKGEPPPGPARTVFSFVFVYGIDY